MVVCYHEAICHAEQMIHYLQCQGHSVGLYNMTIFNLSSKLLVHLQPNMGLIVQHHMPECPVEKWDYCNQGQRHSKGSNSS